MSWFFMLAFRYGFTIDFTLHCINYIVKSPQWLRTYCQILTKLLNFTQTPYSLLNMILTKNSHNFVTYNSRLVSLKEAKLFFFFVRCKPNRNIRCRFRVVSATTSFCFTLHTTFPSYFKSRVIYTDCPNGNATSDRCISMHLILAPANRSNLHGRPVKMNVMSI